MPVCWATWTFPVQSSGTRPSYPPLSPLLILHATQDGETPCTISVASIKTIHLNLIRTGLVHIIVGLHMVLQAVFELYPHSAHVPHCQLQAQCHTEQLQQTLQGPTFFVQAI